MSVCVRAYTRMRGMRPTIQNGIHPGVLSFSLHSTVALIARLCPRIDEVIYMAHAKDYLEGIEEVGGFSIP